MVLVVLIVVSLMTSCPQITRLHYEHLEDIEKLKSYIITIGEKKVLINFRVISAMHDGKEVGIISKEILK